MKMRIGGKIIVVLLTFFMCLMLIPTMVFAEGTPITPLTFKVPGYGPGKSVSGVRVENTDPGITVKSMSVLEHVVETGMWKDATGVFKADTLYGVEIFFNGNAGYDYSGLQQENVKVNGEKPTYFDNPWTESSKGDMRVFHYFKSFYNVTIANPIEHGTVTANKTEGVYTGELVTLTVIPDAGYELDSLIVKESDGYPVVMETENTFKVRHRHVNISAVFKEEELIEHDVFINPSEKGFVTSDKAKAFRGDSVKLTVTPDEGYRLDSLTVHYGRGVEVAYNEDYIFTMPDADAIVNANFDEIIPEGKVRVIFDVQGHSTAPIRQIIDKTSKAIRPDNPKEVGWRFEGWYNEAECTNLFDFETPIEENITLYAKWAENPEVYTVTFEPNGGSEVPQQRVNGGDTIEKPEDPTKTGYNCAGWYTDAECTTLFDFNTGITGDTTLYAKWRRKGSGGTSTHKTPDKENEDTSTTVSETPSDSIDEEEEGPAEENEAEVDAENDATPLKTGFFGAGGIFVIVFILLVLVLLGFGFKKFKEKRKSDIS
jgi:hypothetical protein